jgi:hypothetical protein
MNGFSESNQNEINARRQQIGVCTSIEEGAKSAKKLPS